MIMLRENFQIAAEGDELYTGIIQSIGLPISAEELEVQSKWAKNSAIEYFNATCIPGFSVPAEVVLRKKIKVVEPELNKINEKESIEKCQRLIKRLSEPIDTKFRNGEYNGEYGYQKWQRDVEKMIRKYDEEPNKGVKSEEIREKLVRNPPHYIDFIMEWLNDILNQDPEPDLLKEIRDMSKQEAYLAFRFEQNLRMTEENKKPFFQWNVKEIFLTYLKKDMLKQRYDRLKYERNRLQNSTCTKISKNDSFEDLNDKENAYRRKAYKLIKKYEQEAKLLEKEGYQADAQKIRNDIDALQEEMGNQLILFSIRKEEVKPKSWLTTIGTALGGVGVFAGAVLAGLIALNKK